MGKLEEGSLDESWWITNLPESLALLLVKLVGAFDWDYLVPYPYHQPSYSWILASVALTILVLGVVGVVRYLRYQDHLEDVLGPPWFPVSLFLCWSAATLVTAVELRFTLPIITYLIIVVAALCWNVVENRRLKLGAVLLGVWVFSMPFLIIISIFVRSQSVVGT